MIFFPCFGSFQISLSFLKSSRAPLGKMSHCITATGPWGRYTSALAQCQAEASHEAKVILLEGPVGLHLFFFDNLIHLLIKVFGSTCHQRDDGMIWREHDLYSK